MKSSSLRSRELITAAAILALIIAGSYWKLSTMQGVLITDDIFTSDIMNDGFPYRFYMGQALKAGELPLWYPPVFGGFPLLARAEAGICYPPNLVLFGLLDPYVALNAVILLTLLTAGIGMYLYVREIGAGFPGALLAAFAFAYSGFMVSHLKHLSMVNSACWFPLGLLAIERAMRDDDAPTRRSRIRAMLCLGAVFGMQNLSGHIQIAYYSALAYGAYYLVRLFMLWRLRRPSPRDLLHRGLTPWFIASMASGTMISAVQLLPTYELVLRSQRAGGVTFNYASLFAYDPASFWTFFYPAVNGEPGHASYTGKGIFWEDYGYVGVVTILLAAYALFKRFRSWQVRFFAVAAAAAFLIVLGKNTPAFAVAFDVVPLMKFFRFPTRMIFIVDASLAVLAGIGLTRFLRGPSDPKKERKGARFPPAAGWLILSLAVADLIFFQMRQNAVAPLPQWRTPPRTAAALAGEKGRYRIFTEGGTYTHISAYKDAEGWLGSLTPYIEQREFLQPSLHVLYGFSTANGYAQLTPSYVVDVWGDQNGPGLEAGLSEESHGIVRVHPPYAKLLALHNVKTILTPLPIVGEPLVPRGMIGRVRLYDVPDVLPRAFVVGSYRIATDERQSLASLSATDFRPSREAILMENPGFAPVDSLEASATLLSSTTNEVRVESRSSRPGILVLSDTYYPGWEAEVDGAPAPVLRANHTMRAVVVPGGTHDVRFKFRPQSVLFGFLATLAGMVWMGLMAAFAGRRTS